MQSLEVSLAVRDIYIYDISRLRVKCNFIFVNMPNRIISVIILFMIMP